MMQRMKPAKAMTIRLSQEQAEQLDTVAAVDNRPVSEVIRAAIGEHIEARKRTPHSKMGSSSESPEPRK